MVKKMSDPKYVEIFDEDVFELQLLPDVSYENDYEKFINKPKINGIELVGNKSFEQLGRLRVTNRAIQDIVDTTYNEIFGG